MNVQKQTSYHPEKDKDYIQSYVSRCLLSEGEVSYGSVLETAVNVKKKAR